MSGGDATLSALACARLLDNARIGILGLWSLGQESHECAKVSELLSIAQCYYD